MQSQEILLPETIMPEIENEEKEGKKFYIFKDSYSFILNCSKTKNNLIIDLKLKSSTNKNFYESNLNKNNLLKVSNLFSLCDDIQECYNVLIDNLNKYKDDIKIDSIDKNSLKLLFSLELPTKKKDLHKYYHV